MSPTTLYMVGAGLVGIGIGCINTAFKQSQDQADATLQDLKSARDEIWKAANIDGTSTGERE